MVPVWRLSKIGGAVFSLVGAASAPAYAKDASHPIDLQVQSLSERLAAIGVDVVAPGNLVRDKRSVGAHSKPGFCECSLKMRSDMPFPAQRRKRIHGVMHLSKRDGRSYQGASVRRRQSTASRNSRHDWLASGAKTAIRAACRERPHFTSPKDQQNQRNNRLPRLAGCASPASLWASRRPTLTPYGCSENA